MILSVALIVLLQHVLDFHIGFNNQSPLHQYLYYFKECVKPLPVTVQVIIDYQNIDNL